jgi:regulator of replication initiation timing
MATLESQYWKFLEENPGSTLTFEQWKTEFSKQLGESLKRYKEKEIEKLENQLEEIEMVRYRMEEEGFHYCFKHYSSFEDVDDDEFHRLRNKYLEVSEDLETYVHNKIEKLNNRISNLEDNL